MLVSTPIGKLYYEVHGTPSAKAEDPLVLLNGIMMSTLSWKSFVPAFTASRVLILMDFHDQGQSEKLRKPYDHKVQVEAVISVLDHAGFERADLAGISYGGQIALQVALHAPDRVRRLVVANCGAYTPLQLAEIGHGWNHAAGDGTAYYYATIPSIYSSKFYTDHSEWMEKRRELLIPIFENPAFYESMVRLTDSSEFYDIRDRLSEIKAPTLVIGAEDDVLTPHHEQRALTAQLPDANLVILPDCGHATMYEQPQLFTSLILGHTALDQRDFAI